MGSFLGNSFPRLIQPFRGIRIPDYIVFEDAFEPGTGSGITSNLHIQMIAVPVQMVADKEVRAFCMAVPEGMTIFILFTLAAFFTASTMA